VRLRELCDEVLASFRVARERDLFSDGDRQDARAILARVTPNTAADGRWPAGQGAGFVCLPLTSCM
jgi:hypothetical protein